MKQQTSDLRIATKDDIPHILLLLEKLYTLSCYANYVSWDVKSTRESLEKAIDAPNEDAVVLCNSKGILVASSLTQMFNSKEKTACELALYGEDKGTVKLLMKAYKYWAKKTGCTSILYGGLKSPNEVERYIVRKL